MLVSVRRWEALAANRRPISLSRSLLKPWAGIEKFAMKVYVPTSYPGAWHTILVPVKREIVVMDPEHVYESLLATAIVSVGIVAADEVLDRGHCCTVVAPEPNQPGRRYWR